MNKWSNGNEGAGDRTLRLRGAQGDFDSVRSRWLASNIYGIVRSTKDADFVIRVAPGEFKNLMDALGPGFVRDPEIQFETVTGTRKHLVSEPESGFEIEFFELSDDPHDQQRFARRRKLTVLDHDAWVLTPEDVLVTKLNWLHRAN